MTGFVVTHKENGVTYAVSEGNYNPDIHIKVRELRPSESVFAFKPYKAEVPAPAKPQPREK